MRSVRLVRGCLWIAGGALLLTVRPTLAQVTERDALPVAPPALGGTSRSDLPSVHVLPIPSELEPPGSIPEPAFAPVDPGSAAGGKVLDLIAHIRESLRTTRYQHSTQVDEKMGLFAWDCSGMAAWIVGRASPAARAALASDRPVARDFYDIIARAGTTPRRRGWQRLGSIDAVRPGDVFAWRRPAGWPPRNTGHVGFVLTRPQAVPAIPGAYALRIADATSLPHQNDTRHGANGGGFGEGTLIVMTERGQATAYGWFGTDSRAVVQTAVVFGRL